ncbi:MAG TPA: hypothetical protein VMS96_10325 [Terriglobales bacterium]|nr:hypothetical protein [Terriglobales bacterium]
MSDTSLLLTLGAGCVLFASLLSQGSVRVCQTMSRMGKPRKSS